MKIELIPIPVTDVDKAKAFYVEKIGFHADVDQVVHEGLRFVQLTPPGSACSVVLGVGITPMKPGSVDAYQMVVKDVRTLRKELVAKGVEMTEIDAQPWGVFSSFQDPDGNKWTFQEIPPR